MSAKPRKRNWINKRPGVERQPKNSDDLERRDIGDHLDPDIRGDNENRAARQPDRRLPKRGRPRSACGDKSLPLRFFHNRFIIHFFSGRFFIFSETMIEKGGSKTGNAGKHG